MNLQREDSEVALAGGSRMYDEAKAAQVAAYFLHRGGGTMEYIKIIKLIYLAERENLNRYHEPLTGDLLFSLNQGPIVSTTLDCINKKATRNGEIWDQWIESPTGYCISLKADLKSTEDLEDLSIDDLEIVEDTWKRFGGMSWKQLIRYTHYNCPEWRFPNGSRIPIEYSDVFRALGLQPEAIQRIESSIAENFSSPQDFSFYRPEPATSW